MAKEPTSTEAPAKADISKGSGTPIVLKDRFQIYPATPMVKFNQPSAPAFFADDKRDPRRVLFALICSPELPVRINVMRSLRGNQINGVMTLVEWGVVEWPLTNRRCIVVVFERPVGERVMNSLRDTIKPLGERELIKTVLPPFLVMLRDMSGRAIATRAIRPTNLFYLDGARERVMLGECVSSPPAFDQPVLFEPVESALSHPAGRGGGTIDDDLYSLGITLAFLALGRNPVPDYSDAEIIAAKMNKGSYVFVVGEQRLPLALVELLRGLLCDDPNERWNIEDLDLWSSGKRMSPLQPKQDKRGARGYIFNDVEYLTPRLLANALANSWEEAVKVPQDPNLELWIRRGLEDKDNSIAVADAVRSINSTTPDPQAAGDMALAKTLVLLDLSAPIRYKNISAMPYGLGSLLAAFSAQGADTRVFAECFLREVPKLWLDSHFSPEHSLLGNSFRQIRSYLLQTAMGYGLERVLYELSESAPCYSPLVASDFVTDIAELLPALENASKRADPKSWPIDRHIAAYIAARFEQNIEGQITSVNSPHEGTALLGMLSLLALLQWRLGPETVPGLVSWLGGLVQPIINSYHSRPQRKEMEKEVPKLVRKGSLSDLYNFLDNPDERRKDIDGFAAAREKYHNDTFEIKELQENKLAREDLAERWGRQSAAVASIIICLMVLSLLIIVKLH